MKIVVRRQPAGEKIEERIIDHLVAQDFTFMEALGAICMKANLQFRVDGAAISLIPASADQIRHRSWGVPNNFIELIAAEGIPAKPEHIEDHLKSWGVTFGKSKSATLLAPTATRDFSMLVVKNTQGNLELVGHYVEAVLGSTDHDNEFAQKKTTDELGKIIIPEVSFKKATLEEAISFLRMRSLELDPANQGVNINIFGGQEKVDGKMIPNLDLTNVPLLVVLHYVCDVTKTRYRIEGRNIFIFPINGQPNATAPEVREYNLRRWNTPPDFLKLVAAAGVPPKSKSIAGHLKARGVTFPNGTSASYIPASRSLLVRNTLGNLSLVDAIVGSTVDPEKARKEAGMPVNPGARAIAKKLQMRIPAISFQNTTIEEAITFLRIRSIELDSEADPNRKGLNFVVRAKRGEDKKPKSNLIHSLNARNFTFKEALDAICQNTNHNYQIDEFAVTLFPRRDVQFTQRLWEVPDNFIELIAAEGIQLKSEFVKDHLEAKGVSFGESTSAYFVLRGPLGPSKLVVANTPKNLNLVDAIVKSVFTPSKKARKTPGKAERGPMSGNLEDLNKIIFPKIRLEGATLEETMEFFRLRALELDPAKKGVNINFFGSDQKILKSKIKQLHLDDVPLPAALRQVCLATKTKFKLEGRNISILPVKE